MAPKTGSLSFGDAAAQEVSARYAGQFATRTALKALPAKARCDGMLALVQSDMSFWMFNAALATVSDVPGELLLTPAAGSGRWVRADKAFTAKLAFDFNTLDAAALFTVPEGFAIRLTAHPWWEITASMTGGSTPAIGISSSVTGYTTKGDLLGGATGDLTASLTAGIFLGTIGPKLDTVAEFQALLLEEGNAIRFDRIASAFAAGSGFACFPMSVALAPATP
jgi:hypothetical protein